MKVAILSSSTSIHTIQWAQYLVEQGLDIHVISQHAISPDWPQDIPVTLLPYKGFIGYFLNTFALRKILKDIQPDVLNVHYASGYGTTARLANFHPYVLSVWGSDVFEFPYRSFLHKKLLEKNLASADIIASTSHSMAKQTQLYMSEDKVIEITPFGVNLQKFQIVSQTNEHDSNYITIGTVKTLKHIYGIDVLIKALAILYDGLRVEHPEITDKLQFRIVGGGPDLDSLQVLAHDLGIAHITTFVGAVSHDDVPMELSKLDIYVALSRQESFGVAVVEAQAMGLPVVVSNVGGLPEVVVNHKTGFIVESENPQHAADKLHVLIMDSNLRKEMGIQAQQFVHQHFSWQACAKTMKQVYQKALKHFK